MKDTILNTVLISVALTAILVVVIGDFGSAPRTVAASASRVVEMEKTVVGVRRLPSEAALVAFAG